MHLLLWRHSSWWVETLLLLLMPVMLFSCSHVCSFASTSIRRSVITLFVHALFLQHTFLAHAHLLLAPLIVYATLIVPAALLVHATPILFMYLLSLLLRMMMGGVSLFLAYSVVATHCALMQVAERTTDGSIVRVVCVVLDLTWRCLRE